MKTVKIKFSGMSGIFDPQNNFITNILKRFFDIEITDDPDFLIYSVNSKDYLDYSCVRIFYTPENIVPDFNICDYAIGFHYLTFEDRYIRFPVYLIDSFKAYKGDDYGYNLQLALRKHQNARSALQEKTDFCSFVYSNAEADVCRTAIYSALSNYKQVNSGGRYLNNIGGPINNKLQFQKKHKFVIAFENTSGNGYTTEKIVQAFSACAVPIYWGNPEICREFNPSSFINCHDFKLSSIGEPEAIDRIVKRVKELDQDENKYMRMLETPAFVSDFYVDEQNKMFEAFIYNIFSQNKYEAYRRNQNYWGTRYERKQKIGNAFYWQCRKLIPVRDALKKLSLKYKNMSNV